MKVIDIKDNKKEGKKMFEYKPVEKKNVETDILKLAEKYPCNVLTEESFKSSIRDIFNLLANIVGKTVGPYGGATLIESMGDYHMTKDGFTVLKNIHFNNRKDNTILNLILTISHQMVMKVGDGSTTAILAAHEFIDRLKDNEVFNGMRPKDIQAFVRVYVEYLCKFIQSDAKPVTEENYVEVVEKVARIALNDDDLYTNFIKEIYEKSGVETSISKRNSLTEKPHYEIMDDMFYIAGRYIDKAYCNSENMSKCNLFHPKVLLFNFTLGNEHWDMIKLAYRYMERTDPTARMLIIAPNYDQQFIDHVKTDANNFIAVYSANSDGGAIPFPMVFAKNPYFSNVERVIFEDLAPFLGTNIVNPLDAHEIVKEITEYYKIAASYNQALNAQQKANANYNEMVNAAVQSGEDPRLIERPKVVIPTDDGVKLREKLEDKMGSFFGTCDAVSVGTENIEFHGFNNINQNLVDIHIADAKDQYRQELDEIENQRYISKQYIEAKDRLARIACKSAMIYVGGTNSLEKKMNDDALDDAIHACQSTISYGYTPGNNISIFRAIRKLNTLIADDELADVKIENENNVDIKENKEKLIGIGKILYASFAKVIYRIHANKNPEVTEGEVNAIIAEMENRNECYDLNTETYSSNIINSARTDIEVLMSAITIIGTILSANQYLAAEIQTNKKEKK